MTKKLQSPRPEAGFAEVAPPYFQREVLPHAPDAWIDHEKTRVGYEIPFNRHFYVFKPPRPLEEKPSSGNDLSDCMVTFISIGCY